MGTDRVWIPWQIQGVSEYEYPPPPQHIQQILSGAPISLHVESGVLSWGTEFFLEISRSGELKIEYLSV